MEVQKFLLLSLITTIMLFPGASHADFQNFVRGKMGEYTAWMQANNMDPSPATTVGTAPISIENENITLQVYLRQGHAVRGHSSEIRLINYFGNPPASYFSVAFEDVGNITFYGNYSGGGLVTPENENSFPFEGKGAWQITAPKVYYGSFQVGYKINYLTGRVNVTSFDLERIGLQQRLEHEVYFEGLMDGHGLERFRELIDKSLVKAFAEYVAELQEHPLRNMFRQYWHETLEKTTLLEIIGYTLPPSTPRTTTVESNVFV